MSLSVNLDCKLLPYITAKMRRGHSFINLSVICANIQYCFLFLDFLSNLKSMNNKILSE